jgi:hypothetical protein
MTEAKKARKKSRHLRDILKTGKEVTLPLVDDDGETVELKLWMRKPVYAQQQEATEKARTAQARRKRQLRDPESDEAVTLAEDVSDLETAEDLIGVLVGTKDQEFRQEAYNDILYNKELYPVDDEGETQWAWGEGGQDYIDLLGALAKRSEEIDSYNEALSDDDAELRISYDEDPELKALIEGQEKFDKQVEERVEKARAKERAALEGLPEEKLRKRVRDRYIEAEVSAVWFQEYRTYLLYFSVRYPDNKGRLYFDSADEVLGLPADVQSFLFEEYDDLEAGMSETRNLPSPLPS